MKLFTYRSSAPDGLTLIQRDVPRLRPHEVLVKMKAAAINYRDLMFLKTAWGDRNGTVPLSDGAGEVVGVGPEVTRFRIGDRVATSFFQTWAHGPFTSAHAASALGGERDGVLSEYVALPEEGLVAIPAHLSFEEASTLPCAAVTAWHALFHANDLRAGDTLLLLGTGAVSLFALQFASAAGVRVLITSSDDAKLSRAIALGAHAGLNYRTTPEWDRWAVDESGGIGVDQVLDVGGGETLPRSLNAIRPHGAVSVVGVLSGIHSTLSAVDVLARQARLLGVYVGSRAMFEAMNRAIATNELRPVIDRVFAFDDAAEAFRTFGNGGHFGKIVITFA